MEPENDDFVGSLSAEDQSLARTLARALHADDVEAFLQIYDQIPASISSERLGNIKEMARQVAALTRTTTYRHSPIPAKDLPFFGNAHSLQACQLSVNGPLGANDFSAFKTPPEGRTPVDIKQFDYEDEALKTLQINCAPEQLGVNVDGCGHGSQLDDSGVLQEESLSSGVDLEKNLAKIVTRDLVKIDDDAFHTPPEFQDDALPPASSDQLITTVIDILSRSSPENIEGTMITVKTDADNSTEDTTANSLLTKVDESNDDDNSKDTLMCVEKALSEKDSLDSNSPVGSRRFTQEEDDSGISTVDENDISRDSPTTPNEASFMEKKLHNNKDRSNRRTHSGNNSPKFEKRNAWNYRGETEVKQGRGYTQESGEDSVGWQTRHKRPVKRRDDQYDWKANQNTDGYYGHYNEQSNTHDYPRRSHRDGRFKDRNRMDNHTSNSTSGDRLTEDYHHSVKNGASNWNNNGRGNEDNEVNEKIFTTGNKRNGKRNGWNNSQYGGKKSDKSAKNSTKDKYSETKKEQDFGNHISAVNALQPSTFSYRDALLKASSPKDASNATVSAAAKEDKITFDANDAASYLSSVWTSVVNLHKKDPSKVFIFSDD